MDITTVIAALGMLVTTVLAAAPIALDMLEERDRETELSTLTIAA